LEHATFKEKLIFPLANLVADVYTASLSRATYHFTGMCCNQMGNICYLDNSCALEDFNYTYILRKWWRL